MFGSFVNKIFALGIKNITKKKKEESKRTKAIVYNIESLTNNELGMQLHT